MPSLVANYGITENGSFWFIPNNTENVALDRIESKKALDLREEIERFKIIISSIENAIEQLNMQERAFVHLRYFECKAMSVVTDALGYAEQKSVYRIRRHVLDKLLISLNNLLTFK
jgi:DNA-directed RNA polymerase specialized sigma subunit